MLQVDSGDNTNLIMSTEKTSILTIGHSSHSIDGFVSLLKRYGVTAVADVRSVPYSRYAPQFNHDSLGNYLKLHSIEYVSLGRWLGARSDDPLCYDDEGRVRYDLLAESELFEEGIESVLRGADSRVITLMCSEGRPEDCHRGLLVAQQLVEVHGVEVCHILPDGRLQSHQDMLDMLADYDGQESLFADGREVAISVGLERQIRKVAYVNGDLARQGEDADVHDYDESVVGAMS